MPSGAVQLKCAALLSHATPLFVVPPPLLLSDPEWCQEKANVEHLGVEEGDGENL